MSDTTMELIQLIAQKISKYYNFPGYDYEDLVQEAVLIGLSVLPKFDETRGTVDSFLFISMSNGLRNLRKAKFYDYDRDNDNSVSNSKKRIIGAKGSLENLFYMQEFEDIDIEEIIEKIEHYLPAAYRKDYAKIREGIPVKTMRRNAILKEVKHIYTAIISDREETLTNENGAAY